MIMKRAMIMLIATILIISMTGLALGAEQNRFAYKGENGVASEEFGPPEDAGLPNGLTVREHVRERIVARDEDEGEPPNGEDEDEDEPEGGMPYWHGLTGREFGQMIRTMAHSEPGAVARYMHQWRFNHPTLE